MTTTPDPTPAALARTLRGLVDDDTSGCDRWPDALTHAGDGPAISGADLAVQLADAVIRGTAPTTPDPSQSLAQQHADRDGLPDVAVTLHDLMSAMGGDPIIVRDARSGGQVLLRLYTADEFLAVHLAARETLREDFRPPAMSRAKAAELVAPVTGLFR